MPTLTVRRDRGWADCFRAYRVLVDGIEIGKLPPGGTLHHEISNDAHVVEAKIDWCGSSPLALEASENDRTVVVRSALRGFRLFLALLYVTAERDRYLRLELEHANRLTSH